MQFCLQACSGKETYTSEAFRIVCAVEGGAGPGCRQLLHFEAFRGVQPHLPGDGSHHA